MPSVFDRSGLLKEHSVLVPLDSAGWLLADPIGDGKRFVPTRIYIQYAPVGRRRRSPGSWAPVRVVLDRPDGAQVMTRTFTGAGFGDLPTWAKGLVAAKHPYARVAR